MPILRALSARFSLMPEPGNRRTPIGRASSIWSLRLNGAAFLCRAQSGLKATWGTCRWSAQQAAMRSAPNCAFGGVRLGQGPRVGVVLEGPAAIERQFIERVNGGGGDWADIII